MYIPPFNISPRAINLIAEISAQIERYAIRMEGEDRLRLRKANRIRTIHSSLAIEGNTLSESDVRDIINGKTVVAPLRQIQEVKNAINTYERYSTLDAFSMDDLLRAHGMMMEALTEDAGHFRRGGVGVFSEQGCVHMAPPADRVPYLMQELFDWLASATDHLLIRSCVFHYEFEFIHPFCDGNGRIGRLWQSIILGRLHPLFEHIPVENMVFANQERYYNAISESTRQGQSGPFIDFMLGEILNTLKMRQEGGQDGVQDKVQDKLHDKVQDKPTCGHPAMPECAADILRLLKAEPALTAAALGERLNLKERMVRKYIATLKQAGLIKRIGSNKNGHWETTA